MNPLSRAIMAAAGSSAPVLTLPTTGLLEAWDARSGVTEAGTGVSSWVGLHAGVTMAQSTDARRPSLTTTGGFASVLFNGTSDFLTTTGLSAVAGPRTIYAVMNPLSTASRTYFDCQTGRLLLGGSGGVYVVNDGSVRSSSISIATGLQLITVEHSSSFVSTWKDGTGGAPVACGANKALGGTSSIGANYVGTGSTCHDGHMLFLAVYSATRNTDVEAYIAQEWGV